MVLRRPADDRLRNKYARLPLAENTAPRKDAGLTGNP